MRSDGDDGLQVGADSHVADIENRLDSGSAVVGFSAGVLDSVLVVLIVVAAAVAGAAVAALRHTAAKWFNLPHLEHGLPHAVHSFILSPCCLPQPPHFRSALLCCGVRVFLSCWLLYEDLLMPPTAFWLMLNDSLMPASLAAM